jgi:uncharacterized protein
MSKLIHLITSIFCLGASFTLHAEEPKTIRALLVTGGCCHDYQNQSIIIPEAIQAFSKLKVEWTIEHQKSDDKKSVIEIYNHKDWAKGFDIVVHNECFANVADEEYVNNILKPHLEGLPAVLIHCAMHCYRTGPAKESWWEFCGVHSPGHGPKHPFEVINRAPEHEIMMGLKNWTTPNGELYFIEKVYPSMTPLAESKSEKTGKMETNVWVNSYGPLKTRVFATTIGHHNETMLNDNYQTLITRGFIWALGQSVSDNSK